MANDDMNFGEELEKLLDAHDYALPQVGDIRKGIIVAINQQGVIVDLGLKRDGVVLPSDLAKLNQADRDALNPNDEIAVYVVSTEEADSLTVSIHLAQMNQDWIDAEDLMKSGDIIEGEVNGYNKGGAIVPFGHLRGFIPASHLVDLTPGMSDRKRQQRLAKLRGQKLPLKVIEVDRRRRRLVFSQRDAQREWDEKRRQELLISLQEGDVVTGTISGLRDFGIFVDIGGADGLVHISELAWHRVDHPREVVKVGDQIEVQILSLDRDDQRISLSRKALLQNPWDTVEERYHIRQLVEGTITRIVDYGAFAEIEPGIEGLLHLSQLSRGNVEKATDVVQEGETHLLRIVSIDPERQRIGLSLKEVTANEQIEWMAQLELNAVTEEEEEVDETETEEQTDSTEPVVEATVTEEVEAPTDNAVTASVDDTVTVEDNADTPPVEEQPEALAAPNEVERSTSPEQVVAEVVEGDATETTTTHDQVDNVLPASDVSDVEDTPTDDETPTVDVSEPVDVSESEPTETEEVEDEADASSSEEAIVAEKEEETVEELD